MRAAASLGLAVILAIGGVRGASAQVALGDGDWWTINRDLAATRYSPLDQINKSNVSKLALAWSYPIRAYNTAVPVVVDGTMYFPAGSRLVALDADTGKEVWVHTLERPAKGRPESFSIRGVGYWPGDHEHDPRILVMTGAHLMAFDAATGAPVESFGDNGSVAVGVGYGGTPTIANGVVVIGAATLENPTGVPGNPRAFDVVTGKKLWEFQTVPLPGQPYHDTWGDGWKGRSGTNMWAFMASVDAKKDLVYLPISSPSPNYWGGSRPGANVFGDSIVAVDLKTGKYRWHFQLVHHDLWDSDMPSTAPLIDLDIDGKTVPTLATINKTSNLFELDRETGKPVQPVEERPVPKGDVPGEYYSPTQPFPIKTPPLSRTSFTKADMVTAQDTTPEHAAACEALYEKSGGFINKGPYTPFMYHKDGDPPRSTIQLPGGTGGVNWGGIAADPKTGLLYVNAHDTSLVGWTEKMDHSIKYSFDANDTHDQLYARASINGKGPFFAFQAPIGGKYDAKGAPIGPSAPCYKGPWARLTAIDARTGEIKWAVPLGLLEGLPEGKQLQGDSGSAGPTVTAGGLVFVGATNDKRFRAFDASTGKQLWEAKLGNSANANPMSYRGKDGKQYVAINAGGVIVAYALQ